MDWLNSKEQILQNAKRYRYWILLILAGILLMLFPDSKDTAKKETVIHPKTEITLQESLEQTLSFIQGAGKVAVLLTEKKGEEIIYQIDEDSVFGNQSTSKTTKTLIIKDENRTELGLVRQINPPVLLGAVVVCQGADDPKVKLAIVEAVMRATGLPSTQICVLKMK